MKKPNNPFIRHLRTSSSRLFIRDLTLISMILLLPMIIASMIAYYSYRYASLQERTSHGEYLADTAAENLDTFLEQQNSYISNLLNTKNVKYFILFPESGGALSYDFNTISESVIMKLVVEENIKDVYIYSNLNDVIICAEGLYPREGFFDNGWIDSCSEKANDLQFWLTLRSATDKNRKSYTALSIYKTSINSPYTDIRGTVCVSIDIADLGSIVNMNFLDYDKALYITDGESILCTIQGSTEDLSDCELYSRDLKYCDWQIVAAVSSEIGYSASKPLLSSLMIMMVIGLILSFLLTFLIYSRIVKPFNAIAAMVSVPVVSNRRLKMNQDEETSVVDSVRRVLSENAAASQELRERVEALKRMQSLALQSQINPHMLYNTLDSVNWTVMGLVGLDNDASRMITLLASFLRYAVDNSSLVVTLSTELEHVREYIQLQQLRYENNFHFDLDVEEKVLQYSVIRLIIQPVLENAIEHGIKPLKSGGIVTLRIFEEGSLLHIVIADNGPGIDPEYLKQLRDLMVTGVSSKENGRNIGMHNVHRRIQLFYGDQYGVTIDSALSLGTCVTITFPKE